MTIDLCSGGIFAAILGSRSTVIKSALRRVDTICSYSPHRQDYWRDRYISTLKEFTGFESVALFSTGAEATEAFWRVARVYTGKPGIWGGLVDPDEVGTDHPKCDAMHGMTLGAMIMAGRLTWSSLGVFPELGGDWGHRFGMPHDKTGAMIMEPYHAPSAQFHRIEPTITKIVEMHKTFPDILFCVDEIQGGFGRTGKLWAHEHYKYPTGLPMIKPDFITIGKGCGGGLPLSALLGPKEVMESDSVKEFGHLHSTHSGNPLMCSVGCAVIEAIQRGDLISEAARKGEILSQMLAEFPVRTHSKGLLAGLELLEGEPGVVTRKCLERGVQVCDTGRRWVKLGPALTLEPEIMAQGVQILREVVEEVIHERTPASCGDRGQGPETGGINLPGDGIPSSGTGDDQGGENGGQPGEPVRTS
jgi:acetylornithine/succinyldiaminopimelate/putrescine aminotransferase